MNSLILFFLFQTNSITSPSKSSKSLDTPRSILTQSSNSPLAPTRQNGLSSAHHVTISTKVTSPIYANTSNQSQLSPQPPPVPAKPKYRTPNTQFVPINGDNHPTRMPTHNGLEVDEVNENHCIGFHSSFFSLVGFVCRWFGTVI